MVHMRPFMYHYHLKEVNCVRLKKIITTRIDEQAGLNEKIIKRGAHNYEWMSTQALGKYN